MQCNVKNAVVPPKRDAYKFCCCCCCCCCWCWFHVFVYACVTVYAAAAGSLLHLPQAMRGFTINSIKTKLKRHGVVVDRRGDTAAAATAANGSPAVFDLSNVFDVEENSSTCFKAPKYLSIADPAIDAAMGEGPGAKWPNAYDPYM